MTLPIYLYGHPILRKKATEIDKDYPELDKLIKDMFETMQKADGIGLAAPQVGKSIRLIVIDASSLKDEGSELQDFKRVYINPKLTNNTDETITAEEGCLSVPGVRENVQRYTDIKLDYFDQNFEEKTENLKGFKAIIVQHEIDHLNGKLFVDRISGLKKHLANKKLNSIKKGKVNPFYKVKL